MSLKQVFNDHTEKFSGKWEHYFDVYDRHLARYIGQEFTLLEVGVSNGGSLQIWKKYFGNKVKIVGIDIDPRTMYTEDQITTYCGNQSDPKFIQSVIQQIGQPDVVIDDGSHDQIDVLNTFGILYRHVKNNGVYVIEDLHTAYNGQYNGGITSPFNFLTIASRFVHDVNSTWITEPYTRTLPDLKSVCFYDSMMVLEKEPVVKKNPVYAGTQKVV